MPSIWCNTPIKTFFSTAQTSFATHRFWCLLMFLLFLFHLFHIGKTFSFEDFFHWGNRRKSGWIERAGRGGHAAFVQKLLNTQHGVDVLIKHPLWNGQTHWKSLKKNLPKLNAASHNTTSWYSVTDRCLEYSPVLQGAHLLQDNSSLGGVLLHCNHL